MAYQMISPPSCLLPTPIHFSPCLSPFYSKHNPASDNHTLKHCEKVFPTKYRIPQKDVCPTQINLWIQPCCIQQLIPHCTVLCSYPNVVHIYRNSNLNKFSPTHQQEGRICVQGVRAQISSHGSPGLVTFCQG